MRTALGACLLATILVVPAFADTASKKGSDADEAFMTGIRKIGVMTGRGVRLLARSGPAESRPGRDRPRNASKPAFWIAGSVRFQRLIWLRNGA